jgi:hypothetical protein
MNDADYEARRKRRERERKAGLAFTQTLRERLESERIPIETLMESEEPEQNWRPFGYSSAGESTSGAEE